jgi:hypothetical protein
MFLLKEWESIMNKVSQILMTVLIFTFMQASVQAASVEIKWTEPDKYRDIYPGNDTKKSFRESVFGGLNEHLIQLAEAIPDRFTLKINVTDIDLAGDTHLAGINQIRIIKEMYSPRMNFTFELLDEKGLVVHSGDEKLKDLNFMMGSSLKYRNRFLGYEKNMLDDWFDETFKSFVMK